MTTIPPSLRPRFRPRLMELMRLSFRPSRSQRLNPWPSRRCHLLKARFELQRCGVAAAGDVAEALVSGRRLRPQLRQDLPLRPRRWGKRQRRKRRQSLQRHRRLNCRGLKPSLLNLPLHKRCTTLQFPPVRARERWCWRLDCPDRARVHGSSDTTFIRFRAICCASFFSMTRRSNAFRISCFQICDRC